VGKFAKHLIAPMRKAFIRIVIGTLIAGLIMPTIAGMSIAKYAERNGYFVCDGAEMPSRFPRSLEVVYTKTEATCSELTAKMQLSHPHRW